MTAGTQLRVEPLSRRAFLVRAGLATCSVGFGSSAIADALSRAGGPEKTAPPTLNAWVTLHPDGWVDIIAPGIEMGQGALTTLPRFLAEEMDADWSKVRCIPAPADEGRYGNPLFWGIQITAGSRTCMGYADTLRLAGAQARYVLLAAAARRWNVPQAGLRTEPGVIIHPDGRQRLGFGDVLDLAEVPEPFPSFVDPDFKAQLPDDFFGEAPPSPLAPTPDKESAIRLKSRRDYRLLGVDAPRRDIPSKVDGSAHYGIDVAVPSMRFSSVETGPVAGSRVATLDDRAARAVRGVVAVVNLEYGVAVVATSLPDALRGREALQVTWTRPEPVANFDSRQMLDRFARAASEPADTAGVRTFHVGDEAAAAAARASGRNVTFDLRSEFVYHAPMEPQNAVVRLAPDGRFAEVWVSTQWPTLERDVAAKALGIAVEQVLVHPTLVGGSFGRRQEPGAVIDAANIARQVGGAVKVVWTREDDLKRNPHRQALACHAVATIGADGAVGALHHRVVADSWFARMFPDWFGQYGNSDPGNWVGAIPAYDVPLQTVDCVTERGPIDVCYLRGIGAAQVKFAQESLIDKVARHLGQDVVDYRRRLLHNAPRALAVVDAAAAMADWRRPRTAGRALGFAYVNYSNSHAALAAEVSRTENGFRVHEVWCAADAGFAVQPAILASQVEGGILFGLSIALQEAVTYTDGRVQQSNFHDYSILRMADAPEVTVKVLSSEHPITGVAEIGVMPVAPALNSAIAALTGSHATHLPIAMDPIFSRPS